MQHRRRLHGGHRASSSRPPIGSPGPACRASKSHITQRSFGLRRRKGSWSGQQGAVPGPGPVPPAPARPGLETQAEPGTPRSHTRWLLLLAALSPRLPLAARRGHCGATHLRSGGAPRGLSRAALPTLNLHQPSQGLVLVKSDSWCLEKHRVCMEAEGLLSPSTCKCLL